MGDSLIMVLFAARQTRQWSRKPLPEGTSLGREQVDVWHSKGFGIVLKELLVGVGELAGAGASHGPACASAKFG